MAIYKDPKKLRKDADKALNKISDFLDSKLTGKIGILGSESSREDDGINNAELGLVHEFGSVKKGIPMRSWLRYPIIHNTGAIIKKISKFKNKIEQDVQDGNGQERLMEKLMGTLESVIQKAFSTAGFGTWKPKEPTKKNKGKTSPLIMTGEFRKSVSWEIEKK